MSRAALIIVGALLLAAPAHAAPLSVSLRSRVSVPGALVRLGDVATFQGAPASHALLAKLPIDPTPSPGAARRYTQEEIRARLRVAGLDLQAFVFTGAEAVVVRGSYLTIRAARLVALARSEASRQGFVVGKPVLTPRVVHLHLAGGELVLRARVVRRRPRQIVVEVVVVRDAREIGRRIVVLASTASTAARKVGATKPAKAARLARRGSRKASLTPPRAAVVEAGDPVRILVRDSGIELTIAGICRRAGAVGDRVRVRIPSTQRTLTARVIGPGRVLLDLGGE